MTPEQPGWLLDELAHAGPEHLDPGYVPTYDTKAQSDPQPDLAVLLGAGLGEDSTLLDLGAGTGTFALAAAEHCRTVIAVDVSTEMLAVLMHKCPPPLRERIQTVRAGFLTYQHAGAPADFVYTRHALHHLPDFWKAYALSRIAALMRPGGTLLLRDLVYAFEPAETPFALEDWLAGAAPSRDIGWTRPELEEHIREEHSTYNWLLEAMLDRAGFTIIANHQPGSRIYAAYECRKR